MVGIVFITSPNLSLYKIVLLPAASKPIINILISFWPKSVLNKLVKIFPIMVAYKTDLEQNIFKQIVLMKNRNINIIFCKHDESE